MTVYIVKHLTDIRGVFSTQEQADARVRQLEKTKSGYFYYVTKHVVDKYVEPRTSAGSLD